MSSTVIDGIPRYKVIYENLRSKARTVGPNGKLIGSYSDLSNEFSVGQSTVVRAINMLKKDGFAYGQQGKGTYICNNRKLKSSKLQQIGFVTVSIALEIVRFSKGFDQVFKGKDYGVSIHSAQMDIQKYRNTIEHIADNGLSGVILFGPYCLSGMSSAIDISSLAEAGIPVVAIGGTWPGLHCDRVEHTRLDSARIMAEHAAAGGCQNPGVFLDSKGGTEDDTDEFMDGLSCAFEDHNIKIKKENIFYYDFSDAWVDAHDFTIGAYNLAKREFSRISKCDSLMFQGDGASIGALRALRENGIKVPEQIKLLSGYRGMKPEEIYENVTTVDTNIEEQARIAAELLKKRIEGYDGPMEVHYVPGKLIEGRTT